MWAPFLSMAIVEAVVIFRQSLDGRLSDCRVHAIILIHLLAAVSHGSVDLHCGQFESSFFHTDGITAGVRVSATASAVCGANTPNCLEQPLSRKEIEISKRCDC
jgi:hypothetical protein